MDYAINELAPYDVSSKQKLSWPEMLEVLKAGYNCRTCGSLTKAREQINNGGNKSVDCYGILDGFAQFAMKVKGLATEKDPHGLLELNVADYGKEQNIETWGRLFEIVTFLAPTNEQKDLLATHYSKAILKCFQRAARADLDDTLVLVRSFGLKVRDEEADGYGGLGKIGQTHLKTGDTLNWIYKVDHTIAEEELQQLMLGALLHMARERIRRDLNF